MAYTIKCDAQSITFSPTGSVCESDTVTATYNPGCPVAGATYTWDFGGGISTSTTGAGPKKIKWGKTGSHTVTVTETNGGCSHIVPKTITIKGIDSAQATFTFSPMALCVGQTGTLHYTGGLDPASGYQLNLNYGNPIFVDFGYPTFPVDVPIVWGAPGVVITTYSVADKPGGSGCTSDVTTFPVRVKPNPSDTFTFTTAGCKEATVKHEGFAHNKSIYTWAVTGGGIPVPGGGAPTVNDTGPANITWPSAGTYNVTLSVSDTDGCSTGPYTLPITVTNTAPNNAFTVSPTNACEGDPITVTYTGGSPAAANYVWDFGTGYTIVSGTGQGPYTLTYLGSGAKNITLQVTSGNCSSVVSPAQTVTIKTTPTPLFSSPNDSACTNTAIPFTFNGSASGAATYTWTYSGVSTGGIPGASSQALTWTTAGTYTVTLKVTDNGCTSAVNSEKIVLVAPYTPTFTTAPVSASVCGTATPMTFTYSGNGGAIATNTYNWSFSGGGVGVPGGTLKGPQVVTWPATGTYTVSLSVSNGGCTSAVTSKQVMVNPSPVSTISATSPVCAGSPSTVTYTGTPIPGATYTWAFAGATGGIAGATSQALVWTTAGTYTPTLSVAANGCTSTLGTATIIVSPTYTSSFTSPAAAICGTSTPANFTYTGNAPAGSTYNWIFASATGGIAGATSQALTYASAGTYTVTLSVTAGTCTSAITTHTVVIKDLPTSGFSSISPVCTGSPSAIAYTGTPVAGAVYTWNFNGATGGIAGATSQALVWATAGTYTPTLSVAANGCTSTLSSAPIIVSPTYSSSFTFPAAAICGTSTPANFVYNGNAPAGGTTYNWTYSSVPTGDIPGASSQALTWASAGTYTVTLTVGSGSCASAPTQHNVTIKNQPTSGFSSVSPVCTGSPSALVYTGTPLPGAAYTWTFNGATGGIAGATSQALVWATAGTYTPTLSVAANGCTSTLGTATIIVSPTYTSSFTATTPICGPGNPSTVTYTGNAPSVATYTWTFGGANGSVPGASNQALSWPSSGTYTVTLTVGSGTCQSSVTTHTVVVNDIPSSTFTAASPVCTGSPSAAVYTGAAMPGATYTWTFNGATGGIAGATSQALVWAAAGTYTPTLTVSANGCTSSTTTASVTVNSLNTSPFTVTTPVCVNAASAITYTGNAPSTATYNWTFSGAPTGNIVGASNQAVSWTSSGTYTVTLSVGSGTCQSTVASHTVVVNDIPSSTFSSVSPVCTGSPSALVYTGTPIAGAIYTWAFNGATGSVPGATSQALVWNTAGTYTPTLTVSANGCTSSTTTASITVSPTYTSSFSVTTPICGAATPSAIAYTGNAPSSETYTWTYTGVPSGSVAGATNQSLTWAGSGTYTVTLVVGSGSCQSSVTSHTVVINDVPTSTFSSVSPVCTGFPSAQVYTGTPIPGATYTWTVNGATGTVPGATSQALVWNTAGTYTPTLTVSANGCTSSTTTGSVTVNSLNTSTFNVTTPVCGTGVPSAITYTGDAQPSATYNWTFSGTPSGNIAGASNQAVSWPASGTYTVTLSMGSGSCQSSITSHTVVVNDIPSSAINAASPVCTGVPSAITYAGTPIAGATYTWTFNGATGGVPGATSQALVWASNGTYTPTLSVSANGCISSIGTASVVVSPTYTSIFNVTTPICGVGNPSAITYNGDAPASAAYNWTVNGANGFVAGASNQALSWPASGTYTVTLSVGNGACGSSITSHTVVVNDVPSSAFTASSPVCTTIPSAVTYTGVPIAGAVYNWTFGGATGGIAGATSQALVWNTAGTYTPTLTVSANGCTSSATSVPVQVDGLYTSSFTTTTDTVCGTGIADTLKYTGNGVPGATYTWTLDAGATSVPATGQGPLVVKWSSFGKKIITLAVGSGTCLSPTTKDSVFVNPVPSSTFKTDDDSICTGTTSLLTYTGSASPTATYKWDFYSGSALPGGTVQGPHTVSWPGVGTFLPSLTVKENGCLSTATSAKVVVGSTYTSTFKVSSTSVCGLTTPDTITYTGDAPVGATYRWNFDNGVASPAGGQGPFSVTWATGGLKNITLSVTDGGSCVSALSTQPVTINTVPSSAFTVDNAAICLSQTSNFTYTGGAPNTSTFNWTFAGGNPATYNTDNTPPAITWTTPGIHKAYLSVTNGCQSTADSVTITVGNSYTSTFTTSSTSMCGTGIADTLKYTGNAPLTGITYTWFADGGVATPATGRGPIVIKWATPGTKHATLTVSDGTCPSTVSLDTVQVNPIPTSTFKADKNAVCVGVNSILTYTGNATTAASYNWTFAGGTAIPGSTVQGPQTVTWPHSGTYKPTLTVSENGCTSTTSTVTVTVDTLATTKIHLPWLFACGLNNGALQISITGSTPGGSTLVWDFDGGTGVAGGGGSQFATWTTLGVKKIKLYTTSPGCPAVADSQIFTIYQVPTSAFTTPKNICYGRQNATITYTGNASPAATYTWNFGAGATVLPGGTVQGPQIVNWPIVSTQTFPITLMVQENGCSSTITTDSVVVHTLPISTFTTSSLSLCTGAANTLTYTGDANASATYKWNFDGGTANPLTGQGPIAVSWATAGRKNITLAVTDNYCTSDTILDTVHVFPIPTALFTPDNAGPICQGNSTIFTYNGTASPNATYIWDFGIASATPGTGQGPQTINWQGAGRYPVKLIVTENACTSTQDSVVIVVNQNPTSDFIIPGLGCVAQPLLVSYLGSGTPSATYNWNFYGGTTTSKPNDNPQSVSWSTPGQHEISLVVTENGCSSPVHDTTITLNAIPSPDFSLSADSICAGKIVNIAYNAPLVNTSTYTWFFNGGTPSSAIGIGPNTVTYNSGGPNGTTAAYTIYLLESDGGCVDTVSKQVIVDPIPIPLFTIAPDSVCSGSDVTINFSGIASPAAKYTWTLDDGVLQSGSVTGPGPLVVKYVSANNTTENISLSIVDRGCPNVNPATAPLQVNPTPTANFNAPDINGCNQLDVHFLNLSFGASKYIWLFGDGAVDSLTENPTHHYSNGLYNVELIAMNPFGCKSDTTLAGYVNVQQTPTALFTSTPPPGTEVELKDATFSFLNQSIGASTYLWSFGNADSSTAAYPIYTYADTGRYVVTLIAYNDVGCSDTTYHTEVIVPSNFVKFPNIFTPLDKEGRNSTFKIYGAGIEAVQLSIFDRWGEKVYEGDGFNEGWDGRLNGTMMNTDVFVYYARVVKTDGKVLQMKGDVTLLK